ncbi:homing endonuclease associated repeat-containing protein [Natrinema hispanicum]|uniref:Helix-hairpin-helix domain-containing protein n=1 Tax=Natrinema hispanicum TaxID=392421 RepID=A0A1I0HNC6_9EURY|nr:helix-hairpin-helix domain-containing protein [Natrinema hispanicum]SET85244.1 Helix-hairpin-helix domain-containing protein [Natrinema hispanicum]
MAVDEELLDRLDLRKFNSTYKRRRKIAIFGFLVAVITSLFVPELAVIGILTAIVCVYIYKKSRYSSEQIADRVEQYTVERLETARSLVWEGEKSAAITEVQSLQRDIESLQGGDFDGTCDDTKLCRLYRSIVDVRRYLDRPENYDWPTEKVSNILDPKEPPAFSDESIQSLVERLENAGVNQAQLGALKTRLESEQQALDEVKWALEEGTPVTAAEAFVESVREERTPIPEEISSGHPAGKELAGRVHEMKTLRDELGFRAIVDAAVTYEERGNQEAESDPNAAEAAYTEAASYYDGAAQLASKTDIEVVALERTALSKPDLTAVDGIGSSRARKLERIGIESPSELRDKKRLTEARGIGETRAASLIEAREKLLEDYLRQQRERVEKKREELTPEEKKPEEEVEYSNRSIQSLITQLETVSGNQTQLETLYSRIKSDQQILEQIKRALENDAQETAAEAYMESVREEKTPIVEKIPTEHPAGEELVTRVRNTKATLEELGLRAVVDAAVTYEKKGDREMETDLKSLRSVEAAYDEAVSYYGRAAQLATESDYDVAILEETDLSKPDLTAVDGIGTGRAGRLERIGVESPSDLTEVEKLTEVKGIGETTAESLIEARQRLLENYLRQQQERVEEKRAALPPSTEEQVAELVETTTEALDAAEAAMPTDLPTATEHLDRVETALDDSSIESEQAFAEELSPIEECLRELRSRVQAEKAQREFEESISRVDDLLEQLEAAADRGEYDRAIGYTGPIRQQLDEAKKLLSELDNDVSDQIESRGKRLEKLTTRILRARRRETFEDRLQEIETTVDNAVKADTQDEYTEAVRAYTDAQEKLEEALEVARDAGYSEAWELERRIEQIESARVLAVEQRDEDWETRCTTATSQVDRASRELEKVDQYLDIGDDGAAYNSYQAAREAVEEARSTLENGRVPSERDCWDEIEEMQTRVDEVGGELSSKGIDRPMVSHDELLAYLKELAIIFDESPSPEFVRTYGIYPVDEYEETFGSWNEALNEANLEPVGSRSRRTYSRTDILDSIAAVADKLERPPEATDLNEHGEMSSATVINRFGAWEAAVALAGLTEEPTLEVVREHADGVEATRADSEKQSTSGRQQTFTYQEEEEANDDQENLTPSDEEGKEDETNFSGFRERRQKKERLKNS